MRLHLAALAILLVSTACGSDARLAPTAPGDSQSASLAHFDDHSVVSSAFGVSYYANAGGCLGNPNPYFCVSIPPGPIHLNVAPGRYRVEILSGFGSPGNAAVWDGDASSGTHFGLNVSTPSVTFSHNAGQITLYHWDWYPWDNETAVWEYRVTRLF
ncbi:MAG: hypothetical protein U0132_08295 [Gemmatimonadaceae bacterium]